VVLKENNESRYVNDRASCPLPFYKESVERGRGAYAVVRKVFVEEGHLVNERDKLANDVGLSDRDTSLLSDRVDSAMYTHRKNFSATI